MKIQKDFFFFFFFFFGGGGGGRVGGGLVRVDVNEELKFLWKFKKKKIGGGGRGGPGAVGWECQDGCERRIEVFGKIKKNNNFGGGGGGSGWEGSGWM